MSISGILRGFRKKRQTQTIAAARLAGLRLIHFRVRESYTSALT
jgi:hypothetical protein